MTKVEGHGIIKVYLCFMRENVGERRRSKMRKMKLTLALAAGAAALLTGAILPTATADAELVQTGWRGDVNYDGWLTVADAVGLQKHLIDAEPLSDKMLNLTADVTQDGKVNIFDLVLLKRCLAGGTDTWIGIFEEQEEIVTSTTPAETTTETETTTTITTTGTLPESTSETTTTTTVSVTTTTTTIIEEESPFIGPPPIAQVGASLPSQGDAALVIFYVDFPDCTYSYSPSEDVIRNMAFGAADENSQYYPFESMSAFYGRSSKGQMKLSGNAFRYTTKNPQSYYNENKVALAEECYDAFKDTVDFAEYDKDNDGMIDATLFTAPTAAGDDHWWPCAGGFGDPDYRVDGKAIGHIITGNAQIESEVNYTNFVTSYLHEMGHCMGLPDYYLYTSEDFEGMKGTAGNELMDADASSDFSAYSKLMLGWYRENQIEVYDSSKGSQTFTLKNAQTDDGNCVIIPNGTLADDYCSEYFVIEYNTTGGNNTYHGGMWWQPMLSGVRVIHVMGEMYSDYWWTYPKYQNGSEFTGGDDAGIRLIRLVNEGADPYTTGGTINSSTPGFGWYDSNENEAIDPGVTVIIGELTSEGYSITIANN